MCYPKRNLQTRRPGFNSSLCFSLTETGQPWGEMQSFTLSEKQDWEEKESKKP